MASKEIEETLAKYRIGAKLRRLRLKKSMGLVELASHTGLSSGLLSKLERDKMVPTLATLTRIAMVFGVGLDHFFVDDVIRTTFCVVRGGDRIRLPAEPGSGEPSYYFESLDYPVEGRPMSCYYAEFGEASPAHPSRHRHPGVETVFVIRGRLKITSDSHSVELAAGDALYFDSSENHTYQRVGGARCSALVVTHPG